MIESESQSTEVLPPRLREGATVAVVAPAGPVRTERLTPGLDLLAERFDVRCDDGVFTSTGFLAGDDDRRADELNAAFRDPDVRAIVLARGGYGLTRILDRLDADALRGDPKPIVGFSDATALLAWARTVAGVRGIHGPVVEQLGRLPASDVQWLVHMITTGAPAGAIPADLAAIGASSGKSVSGTLVGGNLCLLCNLIGTPVGAGSDGDVLFIEDVGERPYAVDRYLTHLRNAGRFDRVQVVICGDFSHCAEKVNAPDPDVWAVIDERLRAIDLFGLRGLPVGHGDRNLALPFGGRCEVDVEAGRLVLVESAVS